MLSEQISSDKSVSDKTIFTVEQLNISIRQILENQLGIVWLKAEISNFKPHSSGHFYFSLKDNKAQISAIMFRGHNTKLKFKPHDGLEVIVRGRITVYEPRGTYQIVCESMEPVGAGALQKQFEQLKEKLKLEGLFDSSRKKAIPTYPKTVAVVTSPTGAAIQDILNIMQRRAPNVQIVLVPALVQGAAAASDLRESFSKAEKLNPDVIIIGRGGGSMEDLWCFNDEGLARLIAVSRIPIISAVGHEIDFTICDFVADLRAPTPSAAAELVAKSSNEIIQKLSQLERMLVLTIEKTLKLKRQNYLLFSKRLIDPKRKLADLMLRNDELFNRLENAVRVYLNHQRKDLQIIENKFVSPVVLIARTLDRIKFARQKMETLIFKEVDLTKLRLKNAMGLLDSLSPLQVVDRGYSITTKDAKVIKSIKNVKVKDEVTVKLSDGQIKATVEKIERN